MPSNDDPSSGGASGEISPQLTAFFVEMDILADPERLRGLDLTVLDN